MSDSETIDCFQEMRSIITNRNEFKMKTQNKITIINCYFITLHFIHYPRLWVSFTVFMTTVNARLTVVGN